MLGRRIEEILFIIPEEACLGSLDKVLLLATHKPASVSSQPVNIVGLLM